MVIIYSAHLQIITGSEAQHLQGREALLNHLDSIEDMTDHISGEYSSVVEYVRGTNMDRNGTWGTDTELISIVIHFAWYV